MEAPSRRLNRHIAAVGPEGGGGLAPPGLRTLTPSGFEDVASWVTVYRRSLSTHTYTYTHTHKHTHTHTHTHGVDSFLGRSDVYTERG